MGEGCKRVILVSRALLFLNYRIFMLERNIQDLFIQWKHLHIE